MTIRLIVISLLSAGAVGLYYQAPMLQPYTLQRVVDGDTLVLEPLTDQQELAWADRGPDRVRLVCVSAPERRDAGGPEATAWMAQHLPAGADVELVPAGGKRPRDAFGRILAFAQIDGRDLGIELVRTGRARVNRDFPCSREADYLAAESEARGAGVGIWSSSDAIAPSSQ